MGYTLRCERKTSTISHGSAGGAAFVCVCVFRTRSQDALSNVANSHVTRCSRLGNRACEESHIIPNWPLHYVSTVMDVALAQKGSKFKRFPSLDTFHIVVMGC